ncbi:MAG: hypothetical protein JWR07_426 [Nevskia sp.]|nr:hypothetical protein [Nevskia sp.]
MSLESEYKVVPKQPRSELQEFARWFHQDWQLMYRDFYLGANEYLYGLPGARRKILKAEFGKFLKDNEGATSKKLRGEWFKLGAQAWQPDLVISEALKDFHFMMDNPVPPKGR